MAKARCPHCQASLPEPVVFCGTCGRRVEGWQGAPGAKANGAGQMVLPDGSAPTRRAEVDTDLRRAIARSKGEAPAVTQPMASDPAATQPMKAVTPSPPPTDDDPSSSMARAIEASGPRMVKRIALVVAMGLVAATGAHYLYRALHHAPPPPPRAEVVVNLDAPVAESDPIDPPLDPAAQAKQRRRHRAQKSAATANSAPATANPIAPAPKGAAAVLDPWAKDPPPAVAAAPATAPAPAPVARPIVKNDSPPAVAQMPEDLPDEEAPPSEAELKEQAQAAAYADNIRFVLRAHRAQVVACYERAFKDEQTSPGGKVVLDFTIGSDGKAHKIKTSSNSTSKENLGRCLEQRVAEWDFPQPASDFATSYPFVFSAGS